MEEDIKESINKFEEYLENVKSDDVHKNSMYNDNYGYVTMQFTPFSNKDIENLIARYKDLEEYYRSEKVLWNRKDYIPKSKVKEKIEELENRFFTYKMLFTEEQLIEDEKRILQELLED